MVYIYNINKIQYNMIIIYNNIWYRYHTIFNICYMILYIYVYRETYIQIHTYRESGTYTSRHVSRMQLYKISNRNNTKMLPKPHFGLQDNNNKVFFSNFSVNFLALTLVLIYVTLEVCINLKTVFIRLFKILLWSIYKKLSVSFLSNNLKAWLKVFFVAHKIKIFKRSVLYLSRTYKVSTLYSYQKRYISLSLSLKNPDKI